MVKIFIVTYLESKAFQNEALKKDHSRLILKSRYQFQEAFENCSVTLVCFRSIT